MSELSKIKYVVDGFNVVACAGKFVIGRISAVPQLDGSILLGDVLVGESVVVKHGLLANAIRRFFPSFGTQNFQRLGVGTMLLKTFMDKCRSVGIREIFGNVSCADSQAAPFLRSWYKEYGFRIGISDGRAEFFPVAYKIIWKPEFQLDT